MSRGVWLGLLAWAAASGCTDDDPGIRRLARGDRVVLVSEGGRPPALKTETPPPERALRHVYPEPGTHARVEADDNESFLADPLGGPAGAAKVDFRWVVVRLLEGPDEGTVGAIPRYHLRLAPAGGDAGEEP
jgi:hypothetical protein